MAKPKEKIWWCVKGKELWPMSCRLTKKRVIQAYGGLYLNGQIRDGILELVRIAVREIPAKEHK